MLENARVEYAAANYVYMHYNNFTWQVGSVLIAGIFVYWGFIISKAPPLLIVMLGNLVVLFLMSLWIFYAGHNRQIYRFKLHRIWELEKLLGMEQHRRFQSHYSKESFYQPDGPKGHDLDYYVYFIVSVFGGIPGIFQSKHCCASEWNLCYLIGFGLVIIIVAFGVVWYLRNVDRRTTSKINQIDYR